MQDQACAASWLGAQPAQAEKFSVNFLCLPLLAMVRLCRNPICGKVIVDNQSID
jgi:hypothetical protein